MGNFTLIEIHTLYVHIATSLTQFRKKTLTVGGGITVRLVSIISRLDSTATLQTNWDTFSSFVKYDLETSRTYSDPSPSHILWWSTASLHSNSNIFSSLEESNPVKLQTRLCYTDNSPKLSVLFPSQMAELWGIFHATLFFIICVIFWFYVKVYGQNLVAIKNCKLHICEGL